MRRLAATLLGLAVAAGTGPAWGADKYDAWINVFSMPEFEVRSLEQDTATSSTGQNAVQVIDGNIGVNRVRFAVQRAAQHSFGRDGVDAMTRSLSTMKRFFSSVSADVSDHERIRGSKARGASIAYRSSNGLNCLAALVGLRGSHPQTYDIVIEAHVCGTQRARLIVSKYLADARESTRQINLADDSIAARQRGGAQAAPQETRSQTRIECEEAQGSNGALADFMQRLTRSDLTRFLAAGQSCAVF